jgi:hypothetical protein
LFSFLGDSRKGFNQTAWVLTNLKLTAIILDKQVAMRSRNSNRELSITISDSTFGSETIVRFRMFDILAVQPRDYYFSYMLIRKWLLALGNEYSPVHYEIVSFSEFIIQI